MACFIRSMVILTYRSKFCQCNGKLYQYERQREALRAVFRSVHTESGCLPFQVDLDYDHTLFFREHLYCAGAHFPTQQDMHRGLPNQIFPPGRPHHPKPQCFALLHIAHRRRKLLPTLAPSKRDQQEPVAPHPMPSGTQDGRRYPVGQDSHKPGRLGMVDTCLAVCRRETRVSRSLKQSSHCSCRRRRSGNCSWMN